MMGQQHQQIDEEGRCARHPGIQLHHKKKDGEWRVLLHACPLCVSGLPATGQPISTPASRAISLAAKNEREKMEAATARVGRDKEKSKKKKHKHKSPRRLRREEEDAGKADSGEGNRGDDHHRGEDIDGKAQRRRKSKSRPRGRRDSSTSPLSPMPRSPKPSRARPRSPSPQSPAIGRNQLGYDRNNDVNDNKATEYNEFLEFLKSDAKQQQQQQQQQQQNLLQQQQQQELEQQQQQQVDIGCHLQVGRGQDQNDRDQAMLDHSDHNGAATIDMSDYSAAITVNTVSFHADDSQTTSGESYSVGDLSDVDSSSSGSVIRRELPPQLQNTISHGQAVEQQLNLSQQFNLCPSGQEPLVPQNTSANGIVQQLPQDFPLPPMSRSKSPYDRNKRSKSPYEHNNRPTLSFPNQADDQPMQQSRNQQQSKSPYNQNHHPAPPIKNQAVAQKQEAEDSPRRPDPEDIEEFNNQFVHGPANTMLMHQQHEQHQHQGHSQAHPQSHRPPPCPLASRGGYPLQQQLRQHQYSQQSYPNPHAQQQQAPMDNKPNSTPHQLAVVQHNDSSNDAPTPIPKFLEQDEISVMSMQSSVTRNMQKLQAQNKAAQILQEGNNMNGSGRINYPQSSDESDSNENIQRGGEGGSSLVSSSNPSSISNDSNPEIHTGEFDERGFCKRHPTVRLRKKKFMRGWKVVLRFCPECCLDEMRRVKESRKIRKNSGHDEDSHSRSGKIRSSRRSKGSRSRSDKKKKKKSHKKDDTLKNPPISQLNLSTAGSANNANARDEYDDNRSIGTASTITISSYTHSTGGARWQNYANDGSSVASGDSGSRSAVSNGSGNDNQSVGSSKKGSRVPAKVVASPHVTHMPYTDTDGEHGWYTGQVDAATGMPHGIGMMNYSNGMVYEGEWRDGVSATPSKTREEPLLQGSLQPQPRPPPRSNFYRMASMPRSPSFGGGRSYLATLNEDGSSSDYECGASLQSSRNNCSRSVPRGAIRDNNDVSQSCSLPPKQQQQQRKVVCGMRWTDPRNGTGSYTGEVNALNIPEGMGSMRYDHPAGFVVEGVWNDGEMMSPGDDDIDDDEYGDGGYTNGDADYEDIGNDGYIEGNAVCEDEDEDVRSSTGSFQGYGLAFMGRGGGYHPPRSSSGAASVQ